MINIIELSERTELIEATITYFWKHWGNAKNYDFYHDCIIHSLDTESNLPKFFIALQNDKIIGSYAILRNDLISRQDLVPWFACLYVDSEYRGQHLGARLQEHAINVTREKGFQRLFLSTALHNYYEKYEWELLNTGYYSNGEPTKIYTRAL